MDGLIKHSATINKLLARYGVKFGIYKNGEFKEQLFPFDPIPRVIGHSEFTYLEKGLEQRVNALNCFLLDIYGRKQIVKDGIIPEEFIFSAKGFLPPCDGVVPPKGIYSHISGIDLVQSKDDSWYILEDNLRVPSGASYPMIAREFQRRSAPEEETPRYGKYGRMRHTYLREHRKGYYTTLLFDGELVAHLNEIDDTANTRMELLIKQMVKSQGITEELKTRDQIAWVGAMNNIRNAAEEIILSEIIFT